MPDLADEETVVRSISELVATCPAFASMLDRGVPTAESLVRLGIQLFQEQQFPRAVEAFRSAVALAPDNALFWTNYGTALDRIGSFVDAAACLEYSLRLSNRQPSTWLLLGLVKKKTGELEGCEEAYRIALEQDPGSGIVRQCLGLLKAEQRDYAEAIEFLTGALELGMADAALLANLGKLYYQVGRFPEASHAYDEAAKLDAKNQHYRQMSRKAGFIRDMLRGESVDIALATYLHSPGATDRDLEKDRKALFHAAFGQLSGFGHVDAAKQVGTKYLELWPDSPVLEYLMKAVNGVSDVDRSPSDYIVEYFDSFAEGFDAKLVGVLGYDVPEKICSAIRTSAPAEVLYDAVDIGCGTGLCGPLLRPFAKKLTGVDLSPKMLELAALRGVYDHLVCEEVTAFLNRSAAQFDIVAAADVMIYIGDLKPIFAAAANAIRVGGLFAFSTETWTGESYRLQSSGRFSHSPQYVRSLAASTFVERTSLETTIRLEANARVSGHLFVFHRRP
jgi:predicted TPR repeat methyltransferase